MSIRRVSNAGSFQYTPRRLSKFITVSPSLAVINEAAIKRTGDGTENKKIMEEADEEGISEEQLQEIRKMRVLERLNNWKA